MAKSKIGTEPEGEKFEATRTTPNFKGGLVEKKYTVYFKQNRPYEVYVGRELLRFDPCGINPVSPAKYRKGVPESVVMHPDFISEMQNFTVREVS